jgi:hypothetical protein
MSGGDGMTGAILADIRGTTHGCASSQLKSYWRQGLLNRVSGECKEKIYFISDQGMERLDWLESQKDEEVSDDIIKEFIKLKNQRCKIIRKNGKVFIIPLEKIQ